MLKICLKKNNLSRTLYGCVNWNYKKMYLVYNRILSHSIRVRELKHLDLIKMYQKHIVALYTGAWIETAEVFAKVTNTPVALYTGAWIETMITDEELETQTVALYTGAWIETKYIYNPNISEESRTLYGCVNWNFIRWRWIKRIKRSHSIRVRELKLQENVFGIQPNPSHSIRVRELKLKYKMLVS